MPPYDSDNLPSQIFPVDLLLIGSVLWASAIALSSVLFRSVLRSLLLAYGNVVYSAWVLVPLPACLVVLGLLVALGCRRSVSATASRVLSLLAPVCLLVALGYCSYILSRPSGIYDMPHAHPVSRFVLQHERSYLRVPEWIVGFALGATGVFYALKDKYGGACDVRRTAGPLLAAAALAAVVTRMLLPDSLFAPWILLGVPLTAAAITLCRRALRR